MTKGAKARVKRNLIWLGILGGFFGVLYHLKKVGDERRGGER